MFSLNKFDGLKNSWELLKNKSDNEIKDLLMKGGEEFVFQLSNDVIRENPPPASFPIACSVIHHLSNLRFSNACLENLITSLRKARVLEKDPLKEKGFLQSINSITTSINKKIEHSFYNKTETSQYIGLTENQALFNLCRNALMNSNEPLATALLGQVMGTKNFADMHEKSNLLLLAIEKNFHKFALLLLEAGIDLEKKNSLGETALLMACSNSMEDVALKLIEKGAKVNVTDEQLSTPLIISIKRKMPNLAFSLLEKKAHVNAMNIKGVTPLYAACFYGDYPLVEKLVALKANINTKTLQGNTPLLASSQRKKKGAAMIKLLLSAGADVHVRNKTGLEALMMAIFKQPPSVIAEFVKRGAEVNTANYKGSTPLSCTFWRYDKKKSPKYLELAKNMINLGADITVPYAENTLFESFYSLISSFLAEALSDFPLICEILGSSKSASEFKSRLEMSPVFQILRLEEYPNVNPLAAVYLLRSQELLEFCREKMPSDQFSACLRNLYGRFPKRGVEDFFYKIHSNHFLKSCGQSDEIPEPPDVSLSLLPKYFAQIRFDKSKKPGSRDPAKLRNDGMPTTPKELARGLLLLISLVEGKTAYTGTPPAGSPELLIFHQNFEKLLKHLTYFITKMDLDERTTALLDIAVMGLHCGGKIGEATSMYNILSGRAPETFDETIHTSLHDLRHGIIMNWTVVDSENDVYMVHRYNQYMYLLGKLLALRNAQAFKKSDFLSQMTLTQKDAMKKFDFEYTPSIMISYVQNLFQEIYKNPKTREVALCWFRDFPPKDWRKEVYDGYISLIRDCEDKKMPREKIFQYLEREHYIYLPKEQTVEQTIGKHRVDDLAKAIAHDTSNWNAVFYQPLQKKVEEAKLQARPIDDIVKGLREMGVVSKKDDIKSVREIEMEIKRSQRQEYLCFLSKSWNHQFYDPLFMEIKKVSREEGEKLLVDKGILEKEKPMPKGSLKQILENHRALAFLKLENDHEAAAKGWREEFYEPLLEATREMEGTITREQIAKFLAQRGIWLEPEKDFEELVEKSRGCDFMLEELFEEGDSASFKNGAMSVIKRENIVHLLKTLEIIEDR